MRKHTTRASVQKDYVRLREVSGDMLCLVSATAPSQRIYRAVLEVSAINFTLKSEDEQEAIIAGYRAFLKALTFPLQVLIRSQRLDLRSYIQQIRDASSAAVGGTSTWQEMAESLVDFITKLASQRTLIERHFYIVIPLAPESAGSRSFFPRLPMMGRTKRRQVSLTTSEKARQELDVRVEMVLHQLASIGLHSRRLRGDELAILYHSCLTPERAIRHPLTSASLSSVGRPNRVATGKHGKRGLAASRAAEPAGEQPSLPAHMTERQEDGVPPVPLPDLLHLADLLAPASVEVSRDALCVEDEYVRGIAITAFPREVSVGGWLAPLLLHDEIADVVFHFHPQDSSAMLRQLKRRRAGYTSTHHFNQRQGRLDDPELDVAQEDVLTLLGQVASGEERLFDLGFYVLVRASDRHTLNERSERMMAVLSMLFLDAAAHPTTFEHAQAFRSSLPEARDELMRTLTLDTTSLATAFPFLSNALSMPGGVLVGMTDTGEPVLLNAWDDTLENPHAFIGGVTGAGKSYLGKLMIERDLLLHGKSGRHCYVIDPDQEYTHLAQALGGNVARIAPGSEQHLNPFDLLPAGCDFQAYLREARRGDRLAEKVQDLQALLDIMLADYVPSGSTPLSKREKGLLDRALYETYRKVGITPDPRSHYHQPPLLRDLYDVLTSGVCGADEYDLSSRLFRYVQGSLAGLFAEQTDIDLETHLLVWDVRDMRSELRPVGIFLIADCVWTQVIYNSHIPRSLYIDEAASIIEHPEGGHFLANLSRRARKRYLRVVTMTQNPELFVKDEWGSVVAANAAIKVLKMQDRTSVSAVGERFQLTRGEQQRLLTFGKHEALLLAGDKRVIITIQASQREHELITTDPVELATRYGQEQEQQMYPTSRREQRFSDAVAVTSDGTNHVTDKHNGRKPTRKEDGHHVPERSTTSPEL
jgi:Helicase HerA, central domain